MTKTSPIRSPKREEKFSGALAKLLEAEGLYDIEAEDEYSGGRRVDIEVRLAGRRIAVEAKRGTLPAKRREAMLAAAGRITDELAEAAVAVCYPEEMTDPSKMTANTRLMAAPLGGEFRETDIPGLAAMIRRISDDVSTIEAAAAKFKENLKTAAARLSSDQLDAIVKAVQIPLGSEQPALRAALLVASACLFHSRLDGALAKEEIRQPDKDARTGEDYDGKGWPFRPLRECLLDSALVEEIEKSWNTILAVDYKPVFETALAAVGAAPAVDPSLSKFVQGCGDAAQAAAGALTRGQKDLLGRVFHFILEEAPNTGAFYTSSSAAALLAGLAIRDEDVDLDMDYSVVDPACGTGTLLAAAAERIQEVSEQRGKLGGARLIEKLLHGYDIDITATHMAAVTLGLMSPDVAFEKMNIHRFELGVVPDPVSGGTTPVAGSLELMGNDPLNALAGWPRSRRSAQIDTGKDERLDLSPKDLVIMNPPFTRDSLRHDQLGDIKTVVKEHEKKLFAAHPEVNQRYSGGMFLCLGDKLCNAETGTLALVYPTTACGAPSAREIWRKLLKSFHLEVVVTSRDPQHKFFSENAQTEDSLFVFRRLNADNKTKPTKFVRLKANPSTAAEASLLADSIRNDRPSNSYRTKDYRTKEWPRERLLADDWTPVRFLSDLPTGFIYRWFAEGNAGTVPLQKVARIEPDPRAAYAAYLPDDLADELGRRGLWFNNQAKQAKNGAPPKNTLRAEADRYIRVKPGKDKSADICWNRRGRLFLPCLFRVTSGRTFAIRTSEPAVGFQWAPVHFNGESVDPKNWERAMCVYLNSTIGVLAQIWVSKPGVGISRPVMKMDCMRRIPVPDLTEEQASKLAAVYHRHLDTPLLRLRDEKEDEVRRALDVAMCAALKWSEEEVTGVRKALSLEPIVTNRRAPS